jgi:hypothetical protein
MITISMPYAVELHGSLKKRTYQLVIPCCIFLESLAKCQLGNARIRKTRSLPESSIGKIRESPNEVKN